MASKVKKTAKFRERTKALQQRCTDFFSAKTHLLLHLTFGKYFVKHFSTQFTLRLCNRVTFLTLVMSGEAHTALGLGMAGRQKRRRTDSLPPLDAVFQQSSSSKSPSWRAFQALR